MMAHKPHRVIRKYRGRPRKFNGHCEECGKAICSCQAFRYSDEANAAISNSSPWLCPKCYSQKYGEKLYSPVEQYVVNLRDRIERMLFMWGDLPPEKKAGLEFLWRYLDSELKDIEQAKEKAGDSNG